MSQSAGAVQDIEERPLAISGDADLRLADVVVIGAGQAGLSAAYHLRRRGFVPAEGTGEGTSRVDATHDGAVDATHDGAGPHGAVHDGATPGSGARTFVVLDGEEGPGGAWRHRWKSLRMATVNGIRELPGTAVPEADPEEEAAEMLPRYFGGYEREFELPILRPVSVASVRRADDDPAGRLIVESDAGTWSARAVINATGTWTKPFWPRYPGQFDFAGRQLHVADYVAAEEFAGQRVAVVGGGISAVQLIDEISKVGSTLWFTRREPVWRHGEFSPDLGHDAVALVEERVRQGLPPRSVVSVTGLLWTPKIAESAARGVLVRHPMFTRIEPDGLRMADGAFEPVDAILWATGFRAALDHLAPLKLRELGGGIVMDRTQVAKEPRLHLVGYGPSASTIGANRAGRDAVTRIVKLLDSATIQEPPGSVEERAQLLG